MTLLLGTVIFVILAVGLLITSHLETLTKEVRNFNSNFLRFYIKYSEVEDDKERN